MAVFFEMAKSISSNPGAFRIFRPALPNVPTGGSTKAALFNHCEGVALGSVRGWPLTMSGRSKVNRLFGLVVGLMGLKGLPDWRLTIGAILQPCDKRVVKPFLSHLKGSWYMPLRTKRWRASKSERARSAAML